MSTSLYRAFDADGVLLYVGISSSALRRLGQHAGGPAAWWDRATRVEIEHFPTRTEASDAEQRAIADEAPLFNRTTPGRRERTEFTATRRDIVLARVNRGWSRKQLAVAAGVSRGSVEALENGRNISPSTAKKIGDALDLSPLEILGMEKAA